MAVAVAGDPSTEVTYDIGVLPNTESTRRVTYGEHPRLDGSVRYGGIYSHNSGGITSTVSVSSGDAPSMASIGVGDDDGVATWQVGG